MTWHDLTKAGERVVTSKRAPLPPPGTKSRSILPLRPLPFIRGNISFRDSPSYVLYLTRSKSFPYYLLAIALSLLRSFLLRSRIAFAVRVFQPVSFLSPREPFLPSILSCRFRALYRNLPTPAIYFLEASQTPLIVFYVRLQAPT